MREYSLVEKPHNDAWCDTIEQRAGVECDDDDGEKDERVNPIEKFKPLFAHNTDRGDPYEEHDDC